ncbi:hypothetical protein GCM10010191_33980 [Actinomadura vinacea]|uniref:WXG100 family type VII secretion target n=1 Tax=Actinomadura vinacea TaxID=115336 RepID=A0ABN3J3J4_9ACTN
MQPKPSAGERSSPETAQAYPEYGASSLVRMAKYVALANEVKEELEYIRKMEPNGKSILKVAEGWYAASNKLQASIEFIDFAWYALDVKWNGDGYDSFEKYMRFNVTKVTEANRDALFSAANQLIDLYNDAVQGYNDAVEHMGAVLEKVSGIDPEKSTDGLSAILVQFVKNSMSRRSSLEKALAAKQGKIAEIAGQVAQIRRPGEFPQDVIDRNKWSYDPK